MSSKKIKSSALHAAGLSTFVCQKRYVQSMGGFLENKLVVL